MTILHIFILLIHVLAKMASCRDKLYNYIHMEIIIIEPSYISTFTESFRERLNLKLNTISTCMIYCTDYKIVAICRHCMEDKIIQCL